MANVRSVLIVGGGTAGWMSAAYLNHAFGKSLDITLVEAPGIPTIGVGEATFNTIKLFFETLGLQEQDWMPHCSATYKLGIKFEGWRQDGDSFYHLFERAPQVHGISLLQWWLTLPEAQRPPFDKACFAAWHLCENRKSPRYTDGEAYSTSEHQPYAYHFNAGQLACFLSLLATRRGVRHVIGEVVKVEVTEPGVISEVVLSDGQRLKADMYLDCTGYRGLLIGEALHEAFRPFDATLLCDTAVVTRIPRERLRCGASGIGERPIVPYTVARACGAGWLWKIPLVDSTSAGYVYSSAHASADEAETVLLRSTGVGRKHWQGDVSHVRIRAGRRERGWVGNCVAIGLSHAFVEPLESTGLFFVQYTLSELVNHFPDLPLQTSLRDNYNRIVASCVDRVCDFLALHYLCCYRRDTDFWRDAAAASVSHDLRERLNLWSVRLPTASLISSQYHGFAAHSYAVMLLGLGRHPASTPRALCELDGDVAVRRMQQLQQEARKMVRRLPLHSNYLRSMQ